MRAFDYVVVLMSFVFALALTHVLSRVGEVLLARERVRHSGLQVLTIVNAVVTVYLDWLTLWDARTLQVWTLPATTVLFVFSAANYFTCVAATPEVQAEGPVDLDASYWKNRRLFWGMILALNVLAIPVNALFLGSQSPQLFYSTSLATLPFFAPPLLALLVKAKWAQWVAGLALLVLSLTWMVVFNSALQ